MWSAAWAEAMRERAASVNVADITRIAPMPLDAVFCVKYRHSISACQSASTCTGFGIP